VINLFKLVTKISKFFVTLLIIFKAPIILMVQNYFDDPKLFLDLYPAKF